MNKNIQSQFPFLIMEGSILTSDYTLHFVMVKYEDGTREIYKHVVYINRKPYFDKDPILLDTSDQFEVDSATYKRDFLMNQAYQLGRDKCSDRLVWCNAITVEEFQERYKEGITECYQIMEFNRKHPGKLLRQISKYCLTNPSSKEYYRWHVSCPLGPTSWDHGFWMDTKNNVWHCEKCQASGNSVEPGKLRWKASK